MGLNGVFNIFSHLIIPREPERKALGQPLYSWNCHMKGNGEATVRRHLRCKVQVPQSQNNYWLYPYTTDTRLESKRWRTGLKVWI